MTSQRHPIPVAARFVLMCVFRGGYTVRGSHDSFWHAHLLWICRHLDFESAVTVQSDEFKGSFDSLSSTT